MSTFLHCNLRGPAKPVLAGEGRLGGAFLHVQALGRQTPARASAVLGPPNPGAREESGQSSSPFDASLAATLGRIRAQPERKNSGRKVRFLILCVSVSLFVTSWGGERVLVPTLRADSRRRYSCVGMEGTYRLGHTTDATLMCLRGTDRGKQYPLPQTPSCDRSNPSLIVMDQQTRP